MSTDISFHWFVRSGVHLISRKGIGLAYLPQLVFVICLLRHLDTRYMYTGRFCAGCARDLVIRILRLTISRALRTFRPLKRVRVFLGATARRARAWQPSQAVRRSLQTVFRAEYVAGSECLFSQLPQGSSITSDPFDRIYTSDCQLTRVFVAFQGDHLLSAE